MSEGPSDHLPDQPDFVSAADSADPLRDPTHPDPGDPDPFDAAAFEPDDHDPLAEDPLAADPAWDDPTWDDGSEDEPPSALEPNAPDDGLSEDDLPDADVHAGTDADGGEGGTDPSTIGPDDGWAEDDDELDHPVDPDAAFELDPLAEHSSRAFEETTQIVLGALVASTGQDVTDTGAPVPGWDGVAVGVEPAVSAWAVPVVDPDPGFIDLDLLG